LWRRAFWAGFSGPLPRLAELDAANAAVPLALAAALVAVAAVARWGRLEAAVLLVAGLGMGYGILRDVDLVFWSNREQVAAIEAVNRQIPPDRRVLDGFTGYGALRPHAWYFWWINEYSLALIAENDR